MDEETMSKSIFLSKTFWLGFISVAFGAFQAYTNEQASGDNYFEMVSGTLVVLNRLLTKVAVHIA